ncbi:MAG: DUF4982 domain-containing protein [Phycisphaerales bacterium]|nr:DUF4982 domain-containing protein [Phycisphaerales bacterium]
MRKRYSFNKDWHFSLSDLPEAKEIHFPHECWQKITLPHDWSAGADYERTAPSGLYGGFVKTGIGWYRKVFNITKETLNRRVLIEFDGIFMNSEIWINEKLIGKRPYGYISFAYDITNALTEGLNVIAVRVDCSNQSQSRWYNGCGIYRNVWLTETSKLCIAHHGVYITTPEVSTDRAVIHYEATLLNQTGKPQIVAVHASACHHGVHASACHEERVAEGETTFSHCLEIKNPKLWSPEIPHMYELQIEIQSNGITIDSISTPFGIRKTDFIPHKGFFLNGTPYKFKGVCLHHDGGVVGSAVPETTLRKRLSLLKSMGCNAIRTAHNPFAPEFYDLCDRMGFFVMDELFDGWDVKKAAHDYGLYFNEWYKQDIEDFIKRDRNHPCVVIWSIGNEVHSIETDTTKKLLDIFHTLDPTRPCTCGIASVSQRSDANRALLDIAGYNDGGGACFIYADDHKRRPLQLMIATEAPHTSQTRGFYRTQTWWRDKNLPRIEIPNLTENEIFTDGNLHFRSSYDNAGVRVCARDSWNIAENTPYLCGEFRWSGIDYYGESPGWPSRKSESGVIDTANFPKDHYYLYQSMWTDPHTSPMIHLLPHWTHPTLSPKNVIPVWIYTNCEAAELFLNGKSLGKQMREGRRHLQWDVPYAPGELTAMGLMHGKEVCRKTQRTAGEMKDIRLTADVETPVFDGKSTIQIDCAVCDAKGVMVPHAENAIYFHVDGVELIGTENGNPIDLTSLKATTRTAFNGLCALTVRTTETQNDIRITAGAILGEKIFKTTTAVSIAVKELLFNTSTSSIVDIFYTIDLTEPDQTSLRYTDSFTIHQSTVVKAAIYTSGKKLFTLNEHFTQGQRQPVIDLTHGNKPLSTGIPTGPFAIQARGLWTDGSFTFHFKENGELTRRLDDHHEQQLGYWWYDYPADIFENPDYAGTGEILFHSGERQRIHMTSQAALEMIIDNSQGAISSVYWTSKTISLKKLQTSPL